MSAVDQVFLFDILDGLGNFLNFFRVFIGNFHVEFFLKRHHQFDRIQGVGPQILDKGRVGDDVFFFHTQLFCNDLSNTFFSGIDLRTSC